MTGGQNTLQVSLLELMRELRDQHIPLILGGGYGLYLKQVHQQESSLPTLITGELWPAPRATEDLDILLTTEVVVDATRMRPIRQALDRLGYAPIPGAEYMQFARPISRGQAVKIDLLTGPLGEMADDPRIRIDERRVRPRQSVQLHAHRTDEALGFQDDLLELTLDGVLPDGQLCRATVYVPQPFTLLLMKLCALRDRCTDPTKDLARHHALDLYRIIAMLTEVEFETTRRKVVESSDHPVVNEARRIVAQYFSTSESLGSLRLREHSLWRADMAIDRFLLALRDIFRT